MDWEVFGADRSTLLQSTAENAPELVLVAKNRAGYAFGRHGTFADQLGPWVARTKEAAGELLDAFLHRSSRELLFIDCVRDNSWAVPLVKSRNFQFSRPLTRMLRGPENCPGKPELICATLGPEFG